MKANVFFLPMIFATITTVLPRASGQDDPAIVKTEFIFETAPFPSCHASTIVETKVGLVAAWFGGTREKAKDVGIWMSRHQDGKWSAPVEVTNGAQPDGTRHPCWNPVLFQPKDKPLMLFYKVGPSPQRWWGMLRTSDDSGQTWSGASRLPDGILGPIKNKPAQLANGDLVCPTSTESEESPSVWRVHFEHTSDLGKTWTKSAPSAHGEAPLHAIQPSILFHADGKLQAVGRTRNGKVFQVWSEDNEKTWGMMNLTDLPNPNAGTDAITLKDGRHLLVYNHTTKGRSPMNVAISVDGKRWQAALELENQAGEYSYPAVIQTQDSRVHITYTWRRQRIKHAILDITKIVPRDMSDGNWR